MWFPRSHHAPHAQDSIEYGICSDTHFTQYELSHWLRYLFCKRGAAAMLTHISSVLLHNEYEYGSAPRIATLSARVLWRTVC